jgi:hypothetical protein
MPSSSEDDLTQSLRDSVVRSPDLVVSRDENASAQPSPTTTTRVPSTVTLTSPNVVLASREEMFPCDLVELINLLNSDADADADAESKSAAAPSPSSSVACETDASPSHQYPSLSKSTGDGQSHWQNEALDLPTRRAFWCGDSCRLPDAREIARSLDEIDRVLRARCTHADSTD